MSSPTEASTSLRLQAEFALTGWLRPKNVVVITLRSPQVWPDLRLRTERLTEQGERCTAYRAFVVQLRISVGDELNAAQRDSGF
jgi:hypothetical protein